MSEMGTYRQLEFDSRGLIKHDQRGLSLPVAISALALDASRGFRGMCASPGTFVQWTAR